MHYANQKAKALATVARVRQPSYFITFTCNPYWSEITRELLPGQTYQDRPELVDMVFACKKAQLLADMRQGRVFAPGRQSAAMLLVINYCASGGGCPPQIVGARVTIRVARI